MNKLANYYVVQEMGTNIVSLMSDCHFNVIYATINTTYITL
jgi:hypothetical protein